MFTFKVIFAPLPGRNIGSVTDSVPIRRFATLSGCISALASLDSQTSQWKNSPAIWLISPAFRRQKWLPVRGKLQNRTSVTRWNRLTSANRRDLMVYHMRCIWSCRTCLRLFWRMCSLTGLPGKPSSDMSLKEWSHYWRKATHIVGSV